MAHITLEAEQLGKNGSNLGNQTGASSGYSAPSNPDGVYYIAITFKVKSGNTTNQTPIMVYVKQWSMTLYDEDAFQEQQLSANAFENQPNYRFGFNGMERDDEVKGIGNSYTTFFRGYDPRLARWWSTDPVHHPNKSFYQAFSNNPIIFIDPRGDADYYNLAGKWVGNDGIDDGKIRMITAESTEQFSQWLADYGADVVIGISPEVTVQQDATEAITQISKDSDKARIEKKAYIILDTKANTLTIVRQPTDPQDSESISVNHHNGASFKGIPYRYPANGNENQVIVGQIHGHPDPQAKKDEFGTTETENFVELKQKTSTDDRLAAFQMGVPVFAIDYTGQLYQADPDGTETTSESFDGKDVLIEALEITGGKPSTP